MARKKSIVKEVTQDHGLTEEQFAEWELMETSLEQYKELKGI